MLMFAACANVQAAWYQVELIVFSRLQPDTDGEIWYSNPGLPDRTDSIELITDVADPTGGDAVESLMPFRELDIDSYRLEGIYRVLKLSREYRPLYHTSWQQPALSAVSSRAVHLETFYETVNVEEELPPELAAIQIADESYTPPELLFDGTIRLRSSRFLHVDVDMAYFPKTMPGMGQAGPVSQNRENIYTSQYAEYVRMQESRKIKLNELHYFDHPLFGVILQVSRLQLPETEEQ